MQAVYRVAKGHSKNQPDNHQQAYGANNEPNKKALARVRPGLHRRGRSGPRGVCLRGSVFPTLQKPMAALRTCDLPISHSALLWAQGARAVKQPACERRQEPIDRGAAVLVYSARLKASRGCGSVGRALPSHGRGRRFESVQLQSFSDSFTYRRPGRDSPPGRLHFLCARLLQYEVPCPLRSRRIVEEHFNHPLPGHSLGAGSGKRDVNRHLLRIDLPPENWSS